VPFSFHSTSATVLGRASDTAGDEDIDGILPDLIDGALERLVIRPDLPSDISQACLELVPEEAQPVFRELAQTAYKAVIGAAEGSSQTTGMRWHDSSAENWLVLQDTDTLTLTVEVTPSTEEDGRRKRGAAVSYFFSNGGLVVALNYGSGSSFCLVMCSQVCYFINEDNTEELEYRIRLILSHPRSQSFFDNLRSSNLISCDLRELLLDGVLLGNGLPNGWLVQSMDAGGGYSPSPQCEISRGILIRGLPGDRMLFLGLHCETIFMQDL
jgi:hypothetical protein